MSELQLPASNREQPGEGKQPHYEEPETYEAFFRFRPIAFLEYHARRYRRRSAERNQHSYFDEAIRFSGYILVGCWPLWLFSLVMLAVVGGKFLANSKSFDSNTIGAVCAAALVFVGVVQWWTTRSQHQQMVIQNRFIERQTKIAESQTEQMRREQRAWLSAAQPKMWTFKVGENVQVLVKFKNTGKTPAKVVDTAIKILELPSYVSMKSLNLDETVAATKEIRNCISPSDVLFIRTTIADTPLLTAELDAAIRGETMKLWVFGKVFYRDVIRSELRKTVFCYYWDPNSKQFYAHGQINDME